MSLATESMIIQKWVGAPYCYQGRDSVKGVDCVNLVASILEDLTGDEIPLPRYQKDWERIDPDFFERSFYLYEDRFVGINENDIQFGDVIFFENEGHLSHAGVVVSEYEFIHILNDLHGRVRIDLINTFREQIRMFARYG